MVEISVIIPSYNHPEKIFQCVQSILRQELKEEFEVIIVDSSNAVNQSRLEDLCRIDSRVRLIKLDQQTFPGAARNIGIEESTGNIIALIDADCLANKGWLRNIVENSTTNTILTGVIENGTEKNLMGTCSYLVEFNKFLKFDASKREIDAAATCNFSAQRKVFANAGGFSTDRAFEDFLFCYKFRKSGGIVYQIKDITITHINRTSFNEIVQNQKMLGRYSAIVRKKNGMAPKLVFKFPVLAFALLGFRYVSIFSRVMGTKYFFKFLLFSPIIVFLLFWWCIGFFIGAHED